MLFPVKRNKLNSIFLVSRMYVLYSKLSLNPNHYDNSLTEHILRTPTLSRRWSTYMHDSEILYPFLRNSHRKFTFFQLKKKTSVQVTCTCSDCQKPWMLLLIRTPAVAALCDLSPPHLSVRRSDQTEEAIHSKVAFFLSQPVLQNMIIHTKLMAVFCVITILFIEV